MYKHVPCLFKHFTGLQDNWVAALDSLDDKHKFTIIHRKTASLNGTSRIALIEDGDVLERAAICVTKVAGAALPAAALASQKHGIAGSRYHATGISAIFHPRNPYAPTSHVNFRFFSLEEQSSQRLNWWFGGGFDLTPYYPYEEDAVHWHRLSRAACEPFGSWRYARYKDWCDRYFYLKHRKEPRGVGGLFFDHLNDMPFEDCWNFVKSAGQHFMPAYYPIVKRRKDQHYGERQRRFQQLRRGRYVEYNLLYDRGTLFGLQSGGNPESILLSMPPEVSWRHMQPNPNEGGHERLLYEHFLKIREWV